MYICTYLKQEIRRACQVSSDTFDFTSNVFFRMIHPFNRQRFPVPFLQFGLTPPTTLQQLYIHTYIYSRKMLSSAFIAIIIHTYMRLSAYTYNNIIHDIYVQMYQYQYLCICIIFTNVCLNVSSNYVCIRVSVIVHKCN